MCSSDLTLIPITIIALRATEGAANPADVFIPILCVTYSSTFVGLFTTMLIQRFKIKQFLIILAFMLGISTLLIAFVGTIFWAAPDAETAGTYSGMAGNFILFLIIMIFIFLGLRKKVNMYNSFITGAKDGFKVAVKIIPYLVAMLVAIGVFRDSGAFDYLNKLIANIAGLFTEHTEWTTALPTALMKPLSGSGAQGMMIEAMKHYGPDSFTGFLSSIFQGSTETTFYVLTVYFGAVNIRNTRYAAAAGLIADLAGIITAVFIGYLFFAG